MYIENIVIGKPIVALPILLGSNINDKSYEEITHFTNERFLPKVLVECGITKSIKEIRRNRSDLIKTLNKLDCIDIKIGKRKLYIVVGD